MPRIAGATQVVFGNKALLDFGSGSLSLNDLVQPTQNKQIYLTSQKYTVDLYVYIFWCWWANSDFFSTDRLTF